MRRRTCEDESKGCDGKFVQLKPCNQQSCVLGMVALSCAKVHYIVTLITTSALLKIMDKGTLDQVKMFFNDHFGWDSFK